MDFVTLGDGDDAVKIYRVRTFEPDLGRWVEYRLDNRHGIVERLEGSVDGPESLLETPGGSDSGRDLRTRWTRLTDSEVEFETDTAAPSGEWAPLWRVTLSPEGR